MLSLRDNLEGSMQLSGRPLGPIEHPSPVVGLK